MTETVFADWTPKDTAPHTENVEVYSNSDQVELLLNGKSLGSQPIHPDATPRVWKVSFEAGTLKAVALQHGKIAATEELRTAGKPSRIALSVDHRSLATGWDDVAYVTATIVDERGVVVPRATDLVTFKIDGPAQIIAVDSADDASHEPFQGSQRSAYNGRCVAILKATAPHGQIAVTASAPGLTPDTATLTAAAEPLP